MRCDNNVAALDFASRLKDDRHMGKSTVIRLRTGCALAFAFTFICVASGCAGDLPLPSSSGNPPEMQTTDPLPDIHASGTRLRAVHVRSGNAEAYIYFFDRELGTICGISNSLSSDRRARCVP